MSSNRRVYEIVEGPENMPVQLGFGSSAVVRLARQKASSKLVALKLVYGKDVKGQIELQRKLDHPNILGLLDWFEQKEKKITYMVLEYAEGGTLYDRIKASSFNRGFVRRVFREVCQAVHYLHSRGVMHRDIKPENVLLTKDGHAKLCDFGVANELQEVESEVESQKLKVCGTLEYLSPEMLTLQPHSHKTDIWSLGILLFEMIEGHAPFRGQNAEEMLCAMKIPVYFSDKFSEEEIEIICSILRVHPGRRPEASDILAHRYFAATTTNVSAVVSATSPKPKARHMDPAKQAKLRLSDLKQVRDFCLNIHSRNKKISLKEKLKEKQRSMKVGKHLVAHK